MKTLHRWFRSGSYSLLGNIEVPQKSSGPLGVLIVPPFGWEDVCSYRPLRFLARTLAAHGVPTLRFDLPGTGDSSGDARDPGLFEAWSQSIGDAAGELRAATGVSDVTVVGIRMGAMLALISASRGSDFQDLILWAPAAAGRTVLRELRAFGKMERSEYANGEQTPPQPIPGLEVGGFLISPEMERTLETLDLSALSGMERRRVLVLTRDDFPPDVKVLSALKASGCTVEVKRGLGYSAMMAAPHEALSPAATSQTILEFLKPKDGSRDVKEPAAARTDLRKDSSPAAATTVINADGAIVFESIHTIERWSKTMFGILSEPGPEAPRSDLGVLFLNAGGVRHTGPNRMWVEAARRCAARGVTSLRVDLQGIGESDGEELLDIPSLYQNNLVEQAEIAMESLRFRMGCRQFAAIGLCSGAFWAFHLAIRNPDVRAAILLNPSLFFWDPETVRRRLLHRIVKWKNWHRVVRGQVRRQDFKRAARIVLKGFRANGSDDDDLYFPAEPETMSQAWRALERNRTQLTFLFAEGEPLLREMEDEGLSSNSSLVRCIRIPNVGHTFRPLWAQKLAHEHIDQEIDRVLREDQPHSVSKTNLSAVFHP